MFRLENKLLQAYAKYNKFKIIMMILAISICISSVLILTERLFSSKIEKVPCFLTITMDPLGDCKQLMSDMDTTAIVKDTEMIAVVPENCFAEDYGNSYYMSAIHNDVNIVDKILFGENIQEDGEMLYTDYMLNEQYSIGDKITIGDKEMTLVGRGIVQVEADFIVKETDFFEICEQVGVDEIKINIYYHAYTKYSKLEDIVDKCSDYKGVKNITISETKGKADFLNFILAAKDYIYITVISIINSMFIYTSFIKDKLKDYSIIKISGLSDGCIFIMFIIELLIMYNLAFILSLGITVAFKSIRDSGYYNFLKVCIYTYISIFGLMLIMYYRIIKNKIKMTPMELYRESRVLK